MGTVSDPQNWLNADEAGRLVRSALAGAERDDSPSSPDAEGVHAPDQGPARLIEPGIPERIGGCRLTRLVGRGGMGSVYEAMQDQPRRTVAVKIAAAEAFARSRLRWFSQEIRVLGSLEHVGIARIYEAGTFDVGDGARPYFIMEFVDGTPITTHCRERKLSVEDRVRLIIDVCEALHHAHCLGVVHRDLKPENMLIPRAKGDEQPRPKLLDFGVAHTTSGDMQLTTLHTDVANVVGTVPYMSPEQIVGDLEHVDQRTDVYGIGVVLYELLTGSLPFDVRRGHIAEAARIICNDQPPRLSTMHNALRGDLETIVGKALEKQASRRYQNARELAEDLHRYLQRQPIIARPSSTFYQLKRFAQRNIAFTASVIGAFAILLAAVVILSIMQVRVRQAEREALQTADFLLDVTRRLSSVAGASDVRRSALLETHDFHERKMRAEPRNEKHQRDMVRILHMLGELDIDSGRVDKAAQWYERALQIEAVLGSRFADDPEHRVNLAVSYIKVGDVQRAQHEFHSAMAWYEEALAIHEALVESYPDDVGKRNALAWSYGRVGNIHSILGDPASARRYFERNHELSLLLALENEEDLALLHGLRFSHALLSHVATKERRLDDARRELRQALELDRRLVAEAPHVRQYLSALTGTAADLARLLDAPEDRPEREALLDEAMDHHRQLIELEPDNVSYAGDYARFLTRLGGMYRVEKNWRAADDALTEAVEILQRLCAGDPRNPEQRVRLAGALRARWALDRAMGGDDAARAHLEWAVAELQIASEHDEAPCSTLLVLAQYLLDLVWEDALARAGVAAGRAYEACRGISDVGDLLRLASILVRLEKYERAREIVDAVRELARDMPGPFAEQIEALERQLADRSM